MPFLFFGSWSISSLVAPQLILLDLQGHKDVVTTDWLFCCDFGLQLYWLLFMFLMLDLWYYPVSALFHIAFYSVVRKFCSHTE